MLAYYWGSPSFLMTNKSIDFEKMKWINDNANCLWVGEEEAYQRFLNYLKLRQKLIPYERIIEWF